MLHCADYNGGAGKGIPQPKQSTQCSKPNLLLKPNHRISRAKVHKYGSKEVEALLRGVCAKLEEVIEDRIIMQQLARMEKLNNGNIDFNELKLLQWYDFSGCTKKYT